MKSQRKSHFSHLRHGFSAFPIDTPHFRSQKIHIFGKIKENHPTKNSLASRHFSVVRSGAVGSKLTQVWKEKSFYVCTAGEWRRGKKLQQRSEENKFESHGERTKSSENVIKLPPHHLDPSRARRRREKLHNSTNTNFIFTCDLPVLSLLCFDGG